MTQPSSLYDAAIVGSGPAGASAAHTLAQAGLRVVILEKESLPRYKTCGGGILGRALHFLNEPRPPRVERTCHTAEFFLTKDLHFASTRADPIIQMTMRADFDQWLTTRAVSAGAELRTNSPVQNITLHHTEIHLATTAGILRAQFVVAADGANSFIARKCGWPSHAHPVPALECEVHLPPQDFARFSHAARFDFEPIPNGYAWVFPKATHLSMGVLTLNPKKANLNRAFDAYLRYLNISTVTAIERHGYVIPLTPRDKILARDAILLVGDAAGLADPITAEGISHAILSGQLAGQAIAAAFPSRQKVAAHYHRALDTHILQELRHARRLAKLLYGMPRARNALFRRQGPRLANLMTDLVSGQTTYRQTLFSPANYLKLLSRARSQTRAK